MKTLSILMLEPDEDDRHITEEVTKENAFPATFHFVQKVESLFDVLARMNELPSLILLGIPPTQGDAPQLVSRLKTEARYRYIPLVVLCGTSNPVFIKDCYAAGAASVIEKPAGAEDTGKRIEAFMRYWCETVTLSEDRTSATAETK